MVHRYIKTKVDNKPVLLYLSNCNFCPFMAITSSERQVSCRHMFSIEGNRFIKSTNAYTWNEHVCHPLVDVAIPEWCPLESTLLASMAIPSIVYVKDGDLTKLMGVTTPVNLVSDNHVKHKGYDLVNANTKSFLPDLVNRAVNESGVSSDLTYGYNDFIIPETVAIPIRQKCSLCGEKKETVNRDINLGTCDECWEICESDVTKKHIAFISNFRLNRNIPFSNKLYKKVH